MGESIISEHAYTLAALPALGEVIWAGTARNPASTSTMRLVQCISRHGAMKMEDEKLLRWLQQRRKKRESLVVELPA